MAYMMERLYHGLLYRPENRQFHPLIGLLTIIVQVLILLSDNVIILLLELLIVLLEAALFKNLKNSLTVLWGIFPFLVIIGGLSFIFSGMLPAVAIVMRISIGSITFSFYFTFTNPSDLNRSLEKIHIPSKWAIVPALSLILVPRIAKDAEDTIQTLYLRGIIGGKNFLKWLPKTIAIIIAAVLYRSDFLAQSFYYRGFGVTKRTHYKVLRLTKTELVRLFFWCFLLVFFPILKISPQ